MRSHPSRVRPIACTNRAKRALANRIQRNLDERLGCRTGANHAPRIEVLSGLDMTARPGEDVTVAWSVSDPDGDAVSVTCWQYREAGSCPGEASIERAGADAVTVIVPQSAAAGETVHVILKATDNGEPPLTAYARIILTVT